MCFAAFFTLLGIAMLAGGIFLGFYAWRNNKSAAVFRRPLSRISKLQPGLRRVKGTLKPVGEPMTSPLTQKPCVYFRLAVYEDKTVYSGAPELAGGNVTAFLLGGAAGVLINQAYEAGYGGSSRSSSSWLPLSEEFFHVPSIVEDETGCVELDLRGATVHTKQAARIVSSSERPLPAKLAKMLQEEYDIETVDDSGWLRNLHIIEEMLPVGTKVTLAGSVEPKKSGDLCFRKKDSDLLVTDGDIRKQSQKAGTRGSLAIAGAGLLAFFGLIALFAAVILLVMALVQR